MYERSQRSFISAAQRGKERDYSRCAGYREVLAQFDLSTRFQK